MLAVALLAMLSPGVEVHAEPAALRLDRQISAELTFRAAPGPLSVECSAGKIDQLREVAPGEWHAIWRAPKSLVPQVALIVTRRGDAAGFLALQLSGGGDAEVRTRPGAVVSVNIGAERFGPIRAGADGTALVPVVVPPGIDFAQQGERLIDLHVPRTRTVQLAPIAAEIPVDREREVEIAIAAVTRAGQPLPDAPLELTVSRGAVSAPEAVAPGLFRARWQIPAGAPGEALVRATVPGDPSPSEISVQLVPGEIASIELHAPQDTAVARGSDVELTSLAVDAAGNATDDEMEFFASAGTLSSSATGRGRYRLLLTPPPTLEDAAEVTVTAEARRPGERPSASVRLPLVPVARQDEVPRKLPGRGGAVAIRSGWFGDGHGLQAPLIGVEGALRKPWRAMQLALVVDLWWARARQTTALSSTLMDTRDDFLVASIAGSLRLPVSDATAIWAQAGAGMVGAFARVGVSGQTRGDATSRGVVPAVEIGLGAERRMWGGVPFLEARLLRTRSFALPNLVGALTAFTICAGYRLEMF
jgi:hypothetical protein